MEKACCCATLGDFAVVGMGDSEGRDERVFSSLEHIADHGGDKWWLYLARCSACKTDWMVAQDDRIHDNFYLRRLSTDDASAIRKHGQWPQEFLRYEDVIRLGPDKNSYAKFFNSDDLTDTVKELIEARSEITAGEVAYLFCLSDGEAKRLMDRANKMSWAQLRPFA